MTRTQNSVFNMVTNLGSSLLLVVLNFITRSVFISSLGTDYLGIEGYFSNILSLLSLTELGLGGAIVFKLYKPLAEQDRPRILALMNLYRRVYQLVGLAIIVLGVCLIPFLPYLVKDYDTFASLGLNAVVVFLIYLFNNASTYWFCAYKTAFMDANQKSYILTIVSYLFNLVIALCQILTLLLTKSFLLYLLLPLSLRIVHRLVNARICDKRYPFINDKVEEKITRKELKGFFKDCSALLMYRLSSAAIYATDNIVLTALSGLHVTGLYTNYLSIKTALQSLLSSFSTSFRASLGNIYASGQLEDSRLIFRVINFITVWLYGIAAIGIAVLTDDFIVLWLHDASLVVTSWSAGGRTFITPIALLMGIEIYILGQNSYCDVCRNTMGLFRQLRYRPVASVIINLTIGIVTVPYLGIAGCILGTIIASLTTNLIVDPIVIHKHALKQSPWPYFGRNLLYKLVIGGSGLLCWQLCRFISLAGIPGFIVHGCVCVIVPSGIFVLCFFRTGEFRCLLNLAKDFLAHLPVGRSEQAPPESDK